LEVMLLVRSGADGDLRGRHRRECRA
jgi:hypothetical protein